MKRILTVASVVALVTVTILALADKKQHKEVFAALQPPITTAQYTSDGKLKLPVGFRRWVFLGAPTTPNALNDGEANFPEFHHVYVEEKNLDVYLKTGSFPDGTVLVKELTRVLKPAYPDGSRTEPSGRGYFNGELNGIDASVKDSTRFAKTNGWGYFTFGHHPDWSKN
jgi:Cytochrome P460